MYDKYRFSRDGFDIVYEVMNMDGELRFVGIVRDQEPETIYTRKGRVIKKYTPDYYKDNFENYEPIEYLLFKKLKNRADEFLSDYIEENIDNWDIYFNKDENGQYTFWKKHYNRFREGYEVSTPKSSMNYEEIIDGIAEISLAQARFRYDLKDMELIETYDYYHEDKPVKLFSIFYGGWKELCLALEQYNRGEAHPVFEELVELNKFLDDKKSVWVVLEDGREYQHQRVPNATMIKFDQADGIFYIGGGYSYEPTLKETIPVSEISHFKYGNTTYEMDTEQFDFLKYS